MKKYSLTLSTHIDSETKIGVYELQKNGQSLFEKFFDQIEKEGNLLNDLARAIRIIEDTANLKRRPHTKFKFLKTVGNHKLYEAKAKHLRVYLFQEKHTGRIIVTGGKKSNQKKDIQSIISIIKEYDSE